MFVFVSPLGWGSRPPRPKLQEVWGGGSPPTRRVLGGRELPPNPRGNKNQY